MSDIRVEALLNEYKGNLYEFLVASSLARSFNLELDFLKSLTADFQKMLAQQEQFIREYYPKLLIDLPELANGLVNNLNFTNIIKLQIMGKAALAANDDRFSEGDILVFSDDQTIPISIKICKANSYVNTKSGGMKSFFKKYFSSPKEQEVLNAKIDAILDQQLYELYEEYNLEIDSKFDNWTFAGLPSLPGQLEGNSRDIYLCSLYKLNEIIYDGVKSIFEKSPQLFLKGIYSLIGFSSFNIVQATTFYQNKDGHYHLNQHLVETINEDRYKIEDIKLGELNKNKTSFDIYFPDRTLQLRIKAMNKFTSKSYKINCSVKKN